MQTPDLDGEPVAQLISLFQKREDQLKFPDLDASTLLAAVDEIERQRECVQAAANALDDARQVLLEKEKALRERARQAHDYATIFARNDERLRVELGEIQWEASGRPAKKRRPRPPSSNQVDEEVQVRKKRLVSLETASLDTAALSNAAALSRSAVAAAE